MKYGVISWLALIFCALLAAGIEALCWFQYGGWELLWLLSLCAIIGLPVGALLHECGHALFGLFSKIRARISLSSFSLFKPSSCEIIPRTEKGIKNRLVATTLGGLAINLILVIFGIIAVTVKAVPTYLAIMSPASLYLLIINSLPFETENGKTDGLIICELIKNEDSAKVMLAVLAAEAHILKGKPIAEIEEQLLFDLPQIREDDINFIALTDLRAQWCTARGDGRAVQYAARFEQLKNDYLN